MPATAIITKADYRCLVGSRVQNRFIAAADLGITGAYEPVIYTITWKPGEVVDQARAEALSEVLKRGLNDQPALDCQKVELIRVYTV